MAVNQFRWTRGRLFGVAVTAVALAALLALLAARLAAAQQTAGTLTGSPLVGQRAPDFTITPYNGTLGQRIHLAALKGRPVVVNFWASWCVPCQDEAAILRASWQQHQGDGVVYLGISYQDKADAAKAFLSQYGITYPAAPDDATGSIAIAYGVTGPPETAFIDRNGVVASKVGGALDDGTLERDVRLILKPAAK
ncbi:MAG TPA: TlpA disulfide reductase family protein [Ktedonobacterales bacterium]|jgi:cytochrome c biogenesis protein CcmG/thiol:disulfide interchange protein DsbE